MSNRVVRKTATRLCILCAVMILILSSCNARQARGRATAFILGTYAEVTVYAATQQQADSLAAQALDIAAETERVFSRRSPESELYKLNALGCGYLSDALLEVIASAIHYAELSGGAFDPTVGALCEIWDFENATVPSDDEIASAMSRIGYTRVTINGSYIDLGGTTLDLGAIAKGYAADLAAAYLAQNGAAGMINLGGDIAVCGEKPDGAWRIGIRNPLEQGEQYIDTRQLSDGAIATSGTYERAFDIDGVRYHHILDPNTGYPSQNGTVSATVTADTAASADAISTICLMMPAADALELVRSMDGVSLTLVTESGDLLCSLD